MSQRPLAQIFDLEDTYADGHSEGLGLGLRIAYHVLGDQEWRYRRPSIREALSASERWYVF